MFTQQAELPADNGSTVQYPVLPQNTLIFGAWNLLARSPIRDSGVLVTLRGMVSACLSFAQCIPR